MVDRDAVATIKADRARLVAALEEAGARVTGAAVRCLFHDDRNPSGGIHQGDDGGWRFTCHGCTWNGDENSGDVFEVVRRATGCDFVQACERLGLSNGRAPGRNGCAKPQGNASGTRKPASGTEVAKLAAESRQRLTNDPGAFSHLWQTRGIDKATAERFGLGITGEPGRRFWTMPITDGGGHTVAVKAHRADGQDSKSWWQPKGVNRSHLWPIHLAPDGPVWFCPGELKALAVARVGRAAIGITSGEGSPSKPADLPAHAFELLKGRSVAIVGDDDDSGRAWAEHVKAQVAELGIEARIVDLKLNKGDGLKDVGDWLVRQLVEEQREPEAVAADLDAAWERTDPWHGVIIAELWANPRTWQSVTIIPSGLRDLDFALGGGFRTRGVHLLCGKTGQAKSQLAVAVAVGAARAGTPVGYLSLELGADEIAQLVAASLADVPRGALAHGKVTGPWGDRLAVVMRERSAMPLAVLDDARWPGGLDRDGLAALVADGVRRFGWRLLVLDYLGLLSAPETDQFQADVLNSSALRKLARTNDVALFVVAALRKSQATTYKAADKIQLDDLAGASRLAYDATSVLYVSAEQGDDATGLVHVRPLKLRFAPMKLDTDVQLRWHPKTGAIVDLKRGDEQTVESPD